eukprot:9350226-Pyramimonas_sp.AAC.1
MKKVGKGAYLLPEKRRQWVVDAHIPRSLCQPFAVSTLSAGGCACYRRVDPKLVFWAGQHLVSKPTIQVGNFGCVQKPEDLQSNAPVTKTISRPCNTGVSMPESSDNFLFTAKLAAMTACGSYEARFWTSAVLSGTFSTCDTAFGSSLTSCTLITVGSCALITAGCVVLSGFSGRFSTCTHPRHVRFSASGRSKGSSCFGEDLWEDYEDILLISQLCNCAEKKHEIIIR